MRSRFNQAGPFRRMWLWGLLAAPVYGPCHRVPRPDNHLTRAPKAHVLPAELPVAVAAETKYSFGLWDAGRKGTHTFLVRNEGNAPLTLTGDPTPDPALGAEIVRGCIPPGESGEVRVTWDTGRAGPAFSRQATVRTDDPFRRKLTFAIEGAVRRVLDAAPATLSLGEIYPGRSAVAETVIFSQAWQSFRIEEVACTLPGAVWRVEPAASEMLAACDAKSAYRLMLTAPADLPRGPVEGVLKVRGVPEQAVDESSAREEPLELSIEGRVLRRLALYGDGLDDSGTLELGHLRAGQGLQRRLVMKIRDPQPDVKIVAIRTRPDFLHVTIEPFAGDKAVPGMYHFDIEVSPTAPPGEYLGLQYGEIHVAVDHPRVEDLDLRVFFSIRPGR